MLGGGRMSVTCLSMASEGGPNVGKRVQDASDGAPLRREGRPATMHKRSTQRMTARSVQREGKARGKHPGTYLISSPFKLAAVFLRLQLLKAAHDVGQKMDHDGGYFGLSRHLEWKRRHSSVVLRSGWPGWSEQRDTNPCNLDGLR